MLREIIYPKPISKDNNVEILSFCIYNIIYNTVDNNSQYYVGDHTQPTYQRNMLFTYLYMHYSWRFLACVVGILLGHLSIILFFWLQHFGDSFSV